MQVVVLLLLVAGLALLVLGLMTGSTPLVVASIAASLLAAYGIVRVRRRLGSAAGASKVPDGAPDKASRVAPEKASTSQKARVGAPAAVTAAAPAETASAAPDPEGTVDSEDPATPEPPVADTDPPLRSRGDEPVWVVDGRPRYHLSHCGFLLGRQPEPVPLSQAVEDGFSPCALCDPDSGLAAG